jgi:hypothetical protein
MTINQTVPEVVPTVTRPTQKDVLDMLASTIFIGCSYNVAQRSFNCWPSAYTAKVVFTDNNSVIVSVMQESELVLKYELEIYSTSTPKSMMRQVYSFQRQLNTQKIKLALKMIRIILTFVKDFNDPEKNVDAKTTMNRLDGAYIHTKKVEFKQASAYVKFTMDIPKEPATCSSSSE